MALEIRDLTPDWLGRAMHLANLVPDFKTTSSGHQRKDLDLAKKMRVNYPNQRETRAASAITTPQTNSKAGSRACEWEERASAGVKKKGLSFGPTMERDQLAQQVESAREAAAVERRWSQHRFTRAVLCLQRADHASCSRTHCYTQGSAAQAFLYPSTTAENRSPQLLTISIA
jgi:hypothetical protein